MTYFSRSAADGIHLALAGLFSTLGLAAIPNVAYAHHPTGGKTPASFAEGFLSGIAHPVIGPDHLAMLLLLGAYCGASRHGLRPLLSFVATALVGCLLHAARLDLPHVETGIAASLLVLGVAACAVSKSSRAVTVVVLGAVGLLHGYAYGESIVGAEPMPILAYLIGLSLVQLILAGVLMYAARPREEHAPAHRKITLVRVVGVASALVGVVALAMEMVRPV
jgi:urease accessory protein